MKVLIATKNPGKAREMARIMGESFEVVTLLDLPDAPDLEETGATFQENAVLKAKYYHEWSGLPVVAGDGGLEIDALNGEPGVFSRRWPMGNETPGEPGREKTDQEMIDIAIEKLRGVPDELRRARLVDVEVFYDGTRLITVEDHTDGMIATGRSTDFEPGYPFRAIFRIPQFNKLFRDLNDEEHAEVNHRRRALTKLRGQIPSRA